MRPKGDSFFEARMFLPLRDENPTRTFPVVTVSLIALNVVVFLGTALGPRGLDYYVLRYGAIPYTLTHGPIEGFPVERIAPMAAVFAAMFLHGGLFHLLGNMLYLWIFGNNVEDTLGSARFILFYLLGGAAAAATHIALHPNSTAPMIGASGAIAAVLGAYFILFPRARVRTLLFLFVFVQVLDLPAAVVLGFWFILQFLNAGLGGGVAWFAHIGGFLSGILMIKAASREKRPPQLT
jgi:membrane associated rhomboid family serine protease